MTRPDSSTSLKAIIGRRAQQQDNAQLLRLRLPGGGTGLLVIVADGMGGAVGGQIASELAVDAFKQSMAANGAGIERRLRTALDAANAALAKAITEDRGLKGMGCTLIGAIIEGDRINWISVGDSLLLQSTGRRLLRLNADHSMATVLDQAAQRGEIDTHEAATSEQRHMLRSALTGDAIAMIDEGAAVLAAGTRLIAATDGILTLNQAQIAALMAGAANAEAAAGAIIGAVEARMPDDQDNLTLAVIDIGGGGNAQSVSQHAAPQPAPRRRWAAVLLLVIGLVVSSGAAIALALGVDFAKMLAVSPPMPAPTPSPRPSPASPQTPTESPAAAPVVSQEGPTFQDAKPQPPASDGAKPEPKPVNAAAKPAPTPPTKPVSPPPTPTPIKSPAASPPEPAKQSAAPGAGQTPANPDKPAAPKADTQPPGTRSTKGPL